MMMQDTTYNIVTTVFMHNSVDMENFKISQIYILFFHSTCFQYLKKTPFPSRMRRLIRRPSPSTSRTCECLTKDLGHTYQFGNSRYSWTLKMTKRVIENERS